MMKNMRTKVLVVATGAYGNIGDAVIRRRALEWARPMGEVHVYVGNSPRDWIEQLGIGTGDVEYTAGDRLRWILRALVDFRVKALVLDPGEVRLQKTEFLIEIMYLALSLAVRVRGGKVVRPPRGLGATSRGPLAIHRIACRASTLALWRTVESRERVGAGVLAPDIAFSEPRQDGTPWNDRRLLLISMRGRRAFPSAGWQASVTAIAEKFGLEMRVITQVRQDGARSMEIAQALQCEVDVWDDATSLQQERHLRQLYADAAIVISDRLHVLILSAVAGAVPLEIADGPVPKIRETFALLGVDQIAFDSRGSTSDALKFVQDAVSERENLARSITSAKAQLDAHMRHVHGTA